MFIYYERIYFLGNIVAKIKITVDAYKCERCKHEWQARNKEQYPKVCPKCKSPYCDKPRKQKSKSKHHQD